MKKEELTIREKSNKIINWIKNKNFFSSIKMFLINLSANLWKIAKSLFLALKKIFFSFSNFLIYFFKSLFLIILFLSSFLTTCSAFAIFFLKDSSRLIEKHFGSNISSFAEEIFQISEFFFKGLFLVSFASISVYLTYIFLSYATTNSNEQK